MKVNHVDCSTALKFQWTCIPSDHSSQSGRGTNGSRNASSNTRCREICPRSRFHHAACSLGKYVYIFGGKDRYSPLRDMWRFDTVTQEWEQVENIKSGIPHLQGHTMLTYKSQIVIFGGTFNETSEDTPLWIYNTDLNHVHKFCCESNVVRPVGRREHSAVIYKNCMYIYGGFLDSSGSTDEFWVFNIEEEEWRVIRRHKPGKRHGHVAVVADNRMWLHGGMKGLLALSDLWTFSFGMNTWQKVKGVGASPALSNHTAHVVEKSIILFGGSKSGIFSQDIWIFRIDTLTWRHILTQNGDICPPITLHTSVLLSSALVQNLIRDRSQSVPHLKGKSVISSELKPLRPWTSPTVNSADGELNLPNSSTSHFVDILRLDMLTTDIDGNNNSSEEDIHHRSKTKVTEAETSFCSLEHVQTSDDSSQEQSNIGNKTTGFVHDGLPSQPDLAIRYQSEIVKIRSASAENCGDAVPLLSRFHSMNSEADLGENNLTVTLSDENIYRPEISEQNANIQLSKNIFPADLDEYGNEGGCISSVHFKNMISENEFITKEKLFESTVSFRKGKDSEFLDFHLSENLKTGGPKRSVNVEHASMEMNDFSELNSKKVTVNSLNNFRTAVQMDTNFMNSLSRNNLEPCGKRATFVTELSNDYQSLREGVGNIQPKPKCVSDLIVEDLELCDISEFFHNIQISCPHKPYLRSSSLKDLYSCVNELYDFVESNIETSELSKSQLTRSCGNLSSCHKSDAYVKKFTSHKFFIQKENVRNSSSQLQFKKESSCLKTEAKSGKYIKYVNSSTGKIPFQLSKSRNILYKLPTSEKISVATQTTSSQMSSSDHKLHLTLVESSSRLNHFVTQDTADTGAHKYEAAQSAERQPDSIMTMNSIFTDAKLCILVIGGQTEYHSFLTEPLKMWRCCLY